MRGTIDALSGSSQAASAIRVEMDGIDWGVVIVPRDEQRGRLHDGRSIQCPDTAELEASRQAA
jgi:hypothetical protein